MATGTSRSIPKILSAVLVGVFLLSLCTVEAHQSRLVPWLMYPGFLEADSEKALADTYAVSVEASEAVSYRIESHQDAPLGQTTLFLHVYRGPPSIRS
jgi:hypothetical protein